MRKKGWMACLLTASLSLSIFAGCTVSVGEPEASETSQTESLPPARAQDDYFRFINGEALEDAEFEYGAREAAAAFDDHIIEDQIEGIILDCVSGSGYEAGTEEYVISNAYNCFMDYDFESSEVPEELLSVMQDIDNAASVDELMDIDARLFRDYGVEGILNLNVDLDYIGDGGYVLAFDQYAGIGDVDFKSLEETYAPLNGIKSIGSALLQALGHDREEADSSGNELGYIVMNIYNGTDMEIVNCLFPFMYMQAYTLEEADELLSNVDLQSYLEQVGFDPSNSDRITVTDTDQLTAINDQLTDDNLEALKAWELMNFFNAYKRFIVNGYEELSAYTSVDYAAIEDQAVDEIRNTFIDQTDVLYVERYWNDEMDNALVSMCDDIRDGYEDLISSADWLSEGTREGLLTKLRDIVYITGADMERQDPSRYAGFTYDNYLDLYLQNMRLKQQRLIDSISTPHDREQVTMPMQIFNACYNPSNNSILITVAITNAPFFDINADYYTNLGGLGAVIAHEMGHAFDSNGILFNPERTYDPSWLPEEDYQALTDRNAEAVEYFEDNFTVFGVYHVDGEQTLGENYADLGGMEVITSLAHNNEERRRIFENYAKIWCGKVVDEALIDQLDTDVHSPSAIRVNAILSTLDAFYEVYGPEPGDGMYIAPEDRISRWH